MGGWGWGGVFFFFFFNDTATTEIYTLSLHDALPILEIDAMQLRPEGLIIIKAIPVAHRLFKQGHIVRILRLFHMQHHPTRSEEHTSELQSLTNLVCRLLLEKKKKQPTPPPPHIITTNS